MAFCTPGAPGDVPLVEPPSVALRGAAKNGAWGAIGGVGGTGAAFVTTWLIARSLGAQDAGLLFSAVAVVTVATGLLTVGADTGLVWSLSRDVSLRGGRESRALVRIASVPVALLGLLGAVALWFGAALVTDVLGVGRGLTDALQIMSIAVAVGPLESALAQGTRGLGDVRGVVFIHQLGLPVLRGLAIAGMVVLGAESLSSIAAAWALPVVVALCAAIFVMRRRLRQQRDIATTALTPPSSELRRTFWRFSLPRGIATTGSLALTWTDVLLVAALSSPRDAGIYAAASRFAIAGQVAVQALRLGIAPQISVASARGDQAQVSLLYGVTAQWAVVVCWPLLVTIAFYAPQFLSLFGPEFTAGSTALRIICVGMMLSVAAGNVGTVLLMSGNSSWLARLVWCALGTNLILNLILIPRIGIIGAAVAWNASLVVENIGGAYLLVRKLGIIGHGRDFWRAATLTVFAAAASAIIARLAFQQDAVALAAHIVLVSVAMVVVVRLIWQSLHLSVLTRRWQRSQEVT